MAVASPLRPDGSGPSGPGEPLSPELALVSPELAAAARARLPERPWEAFAPPPAASQPEPASALRLAAPPPVPPRAAPLRPAPAPRRPLRSRPLVRTTAWVAAAAAALTLASLPVRDAPTLSPRDDARAAAPAPALTPPSVVPPGTNRAQARPGEYPIAGHGGFVVVARPPAVTALAFRTRCGAPSGVSVAIAADGSFAGGENVSAAGRRTTLEVSGRFLDPDTAAGTVRVLRAGCDSGLVPFVANRRG